MNKFILFKSVVLFFLIIYDIGFKSNDFSFFLYYTAILSLLLIEIVIKYLIRFLSGIKLFLIDYLIIGLLLIILLIHLYLLRRPFYQSEFGLQLIILLFLITLVSKVSISFDKLKLNPPLLFIFSYLFLIVVGTSLLLLPNATNERISIIDALFTATSAVCVTGLIVVDTASYFTEFGQTLILILIQIGGLGIMTFTSFFSFFFKGKFYFENQLYIKEFVNEERVGEIFRTIVKIITFTFLFEAIGAIAIYNSLDPSLFNGFLDQAKFSIFHSISAFCNAGFSTLPDGLHTAALRANYPLLWIVAVLIIVGGIGFPVMINLYNYCKAVLYHSWLGWFTKRRIAIPRIISLNTWLVFVTTSILLVGGTVLYLFAEFDNTLKSETIWGKLSSAFFGAVTPRSGGFHIVDLSTLAMPTLLIYLLLMWIGASPGGTGGGLKTSTFAIAILTTISISKNSDRLEIHNREIPNESIKRAFTIIHLSFIVIGLAVFLITLFDPEKRLIEVAFECFSAYSTTGLSLGITASLTIPSKIVIIFTMFLGRVGMLTLLIGLIRDVKTLNYQLPKESIFIN